MRIGFVLLLILMACFMMSLQRYQPSRDEQLVNEIIAKTAKTVKNEFGIQPCGFGASMPGGPIRTINLCFSTRFPYSRDQLGELLVKTAEIMVLEVNKNEEIQQFLYKRPFTEKNTHIIIFNHDETGLELFDPDICGAQISEDGLIYRTKDFDKQFGYKNTYEESYEEALKLLRP